MRSEHQRCATGGEYLRFKEPAEIGRREGVEAAGWFIEQENLWLRKERAEQAEPLNGAGGKGAHLAIHGVGKRELLGGRGDASFQVIIGKMIEAAEETQIFAAGQSWIKTQIGAGMIAKMAADRCGFTDHIEARDADAAARGEQQRGENAKQRGFAGAVGPEQCDGFAGANLQRNAAESGNSWGRERLSERAPSAVGGRKPFFEGIDDYRGIGH